MKTALEKISENAIKLFVLLFLGIGVIIFIVLTIALIKMVFEI